MSLVAYAASDESDTSDTEESRVSNKKEKEDTEAPDSTARGEISDDDDYTPSESSHQASSSSGPTSSLDISAPSDLSDLPAPKSARPTSTFILQEEDQLEEEVKPKAAQLANAPKPPAPRKAKQPARIVLPALQNDSDEEDDSKTKSKQNASAGGKASSLFSLLPPPVHGTKKQANRPLIPYTLTKRPAPDSSKSAGSSKKASMLVTSSQNVMDTEPLPSQKHKSAFNALTGYESDSDEDETGPSGGMNFFSLDAEAQAASSTSQLTVVKNSAPQVQTGDKTAGTTGVVEAGSRKSDLGDNNSPMNSKSGDEPGADLSISLPAVSPTDILLPASTTSKSAEDDGDEEAVTVVAGVPQVNQDAPLNFRGSQMRSGWTAAPLAAPMMPELYAMAPTKSMAAGASQWRTQQHFAQDTYSAQQEEEGSTGYDMGASGSDDLQQYMADEQFLRLAPGSGKRKRSQEGIQIIDANVDDCVDPNELMKGISEESSYQPHRKKDNLPSSQQRRKKQITYLAFQAKERELELKNQWSQNRMTKNHARSKYGF